MYELAKPGSILNEPIRVLDVPSALTTPRIVVGGPIHKTIVVSKR